MHGADFECVRNRAGCSQYEIEVHGLSCPFCSYGIEKQLYNIEAVSQVSVDLSQGRVQIDTHPGRTTDKAELRQAVEDAGFELQGYRELEDSAATE